MSKGAVAPAPDGVKVHHACVPRSSLVAGLVLVAAVVLAFGNSMDGPFVFDDRGAILENPSLRRLWPLSGPLSPPPGGQTISGRPLVNLSLAINYALGGIDPRGYHVFNVAVHALASLVLFGIVRRTLARFAVGPPGRRVDLARDSLPIAFVIALLWGLHPVQTASVAYLAQRAESLMGLFFLLTLYCFIRGNTPATAHGGVEPREAALSPGTRRPAVWFGLSFLACLAGMATKEVMVTAPLLVALYDRTFHAGSFREAWLRRRGLYIALAATWLLLAYLIVESRARGGTVGFASGMSPWHYLLTQCLAIAGYLKLSLWPHPLVFDHGTGVVTRLVDILPQAMLVLTLLGATAMALARRPALGFLGAWFFAILAPTSSFVPIASQTIAEHRMYLPLAAVLAGVVLGTYALAGRRSLVPLLLLSLVAGGLTMLRNRTYRSEVGLWADTVARAPANIRAHVNLGSALLDADRPAEAATAFEQALRLEPNASEVYVNLCQAYARLGRMEEALAHGEAALRLQPGNPDAHINLASALVRLGRLEEAIGHYTAARRIQPEKEDLRVALADALVLRSQTLARQGAAGEADRHVAEALRIAPNHAEACFVSGNLAAAAENFDAAIAAYRRALELAPDHVAARNNLANALLVTGRANEAIAEYERVLQQRPGDAAVQRNLAAARALRQASPPRP